MENEGSSGFREDLGTYFEPLVPQEDGAICSVEVGPRLEQWALADSTKNDSRPISRIWWEWARNEF